MTIDRKYFMGARHAGKTYAMLQMFIRQVKIGEKAIVHAPDYVVMSRNLYNKFVDEIHENKIKKIVKIIESELTKNE